MAKCVHSWVPRPDKGTTGISRYRCSVCKRWGRIDLKRGGGVKMYKKTPTELLHADNDVVPHTEIVHEYGAEFFRGPEAERE